MNHGAICEPIDINPDISVLAEHVVRNPEALPPDRFAHFHDAAELIWYRNVRGTMVTEVGDFTLENNMAIFVPSMHSHDFIIESGSQEWVLVYVDPSLVSTLIKEDNLPTLDTPICISFDETQAPRLDSLFAWLADKETVSTHNTQSARIAKLILAEMAISESNNPKARKDDLNRLQRLRPALDLVAQNPSTSISLEEASAVCNLSTTYFSRRFKDVFGMNFSEYVRTFRLRLGARQLLSSGDRISEIAYGLGFASPAHFTALFQKRFGLSPREYRSQLRTK